MPMLMPITNIEHLEYVLARMHPVVNKVIHKTRGALEIISACHCQYVPELEVLTTLLDLIADIVGNDIPTNEPNATPI